MAVQESATAEIEVRLLGAVEVVGSARPFRRAGALDLVAYLAVHPGGVANEAWATALWPDRLLAPATLHSIVSCARRSLGRSTSGRDHLPHAHGRLALGATVTTDWRRFQRLASSDHPAGPARALELVRGAPFLGLRHADWTVLEGFRAEIEEAVGRTTNEVATAAIERGRPAAARAAARRGLLASPYDERLYRILMRAADLDGNPGGVVSVMHELLGVLQGEPGWRPGRPGWGEVAEMVHPETHRLYCRLARGFGGLGQPRPEAGPTAPATGARLVTL